MYVFFIINVSTYTYTPQNGSLGKLYRMSQAITDQLGDVHVQCAVIRFLEFIQIHEVVNVGPHIVVVLDVIQHTLC